ncbi:MAG: molybdopterin-dependent oxidoreductase, partial [Deltaproteobacteria bacterium]|nr:molybdopterin-dependent oxidoreductase [Deltaproteobacteria bacterium]
MPVHPSICRFCSAYCGISVEVEAGKAVRVRGDREDPVYAGFCCPKGRALPAQHAHSERLCHSQKRIADGSHHPIDSTQAMDEISAKVASIVERHGPRSVAVYVGTYGGIHPTASAFGVGWLLALGSRMVFTAATIDQPGKNIANALHGRWLGGPYLFDEADAWLIVGANPIVSFSGGISPANTARRIRDARRRGQQLVVIDPRRSEVTRFADLHLQPRPGQDPALLAAMLHVILTEERFDRAFVTVNTQGFEALKSAVTPFDPQTAARRAGIPAQDIVRAAHIISSGRRGCALAGTGPNMSGHGNLTEYLLLCLTTLCGYWRREGEKLPNPGVLLPSAEPKAQPSPPRPAWGYGEKLRVRGLTNTTAGLPTAALADEILLEGEGRVRVLVCIGGNPAVAWPDQRRTLAALDNLDLCVTLDIKMSATAQRADYVIAPKLSLEVPGFTLPVESYEQSYLAVGYPEPYARYTPAVVDPPA